MDGGTAPAGGAMMVEQPQPEELYGWWNSPSQRSCVDDGTAPAIGAVIGGTAPAGGAVWMMEQPQLEEL